ncbi:MAG: FecR domain-containing protein [Pedobacter sp.]|uniref:FecR family protein n=1 Tax=Pedobacter sp. TaxID=1411316 RepID=UPI003399F0FF
MEKIRIRELLVKKISANATEEELLELTALLKRFPEYQQIEEVTRVLKSDIKATPRDEEVQLQLNRIWKQINAATNRPSPVLKNRKSLDYKRWIAAAAVLLCVFTAGVVLYQNRYADRQGVSGAYKTWKVPFGKTLRIQLPDGSTVKMNAGTILSYPVHFAAGSREVMLQGEAYFEVTKNPHRPFLVHAGNLTVKVLGTAFNVKAYQDDANVETTLIHGKVQVVMDGEPDKQITLVPNEKLTVSKRFSNIKTAHLPGEVKYKLQTIAGSIAADDIYEIAWLSRKVAFNNESFGEVAKVIERKYKVKLVFQQEQLKSELITGVFETEDLKRALHLLQMITEFEYELKGDTIILSISKTK